MNKEKGISLIEVLLVVVAVVILAILISSLPQSIVTIRKSNNISLAKEIASRELDLLRRQSYTNLVS